MAEQGSILGDNSSRLHRYPFAKGKILDRNVTPALKWKGSYGPQGASPGFFVLKSQGFSPHPLTETLSRQNPSLKKIKNLIREMARQQAHICSSTGKNYSFREVDQARHLLPRMSWDRARLTALQLGLKGTGAWDSPSLNPTIILDSLSCSSSAV